ncbi:hypothetical protein EDB81DRAFT_808492 [Dactylonectria macrodidyma]|uniref:Zn(2)-C6 fungal-type domain-containing protein n=1 Tax=Dactylonectria macrodidyma TaxID=307937 RepID=A0A9P9DYU9_9HYPO|nr:hypothetical protein EDB81DRAFT_808492 [Dactylonectria macrodidyma]
MHRQLFTVNAMSMQHSRPSISGKSRVRTGCRTCKVRRIKCDEARPSCQKCSSTGRRCEGYGIWGGQRSMESSHLASSRPSLKSNISTGPLHSLNDHDQACFSWFRHRTVGKLPGIFRTCFWDDLVLRACFEEPAVLHAALALGSVHKVGNSGCSMQLDDSHLPGDSEKFTLKHYNIAIRHMQPCLWSNSKTSLRITLIISMMFTCMEFLLGHYRTGEVHLKHGTKLMASLISPGDSAIDLETPRDAVDVELLEAFATMNLNCFLLGRGTLGMYRTLQSFDTQPLQAMFESMAQARKNLDWVLADTIRLTQRRHAMAMTNSSDANPPNDWVHHQRRIQTQLASWDKVFKVSRVSLIAQMGFGGQIAYLHLRLFHTMTSIMAATCLHPRGEMAFDAHTANFEAIIAQSQVFHDTIFATDFANTRLEHIQNATSFTADRGWIAPLYFTAIKCRVSHIRRQAIQLLGSTASREGLWDAEVVASVAQEIVRLEENPSCVPVIHPKDVAPDLADLSHELKRRVVPEERRISQVEVLLPNGAGDRIRIKIYRPEKGIRAKVFVREQDPTTGIWNSMDVDKSWSPKQSLQQHIICPS